MSNTQPIVVDDARWERILALTGNAAAACQTCGDCTVVCKWRLFGPDGPDMRALLRNIQLGDNKDPALDDALWICATCGSCESVCPEGVSTADLIVGLRSMALEDGHIPPSLQKVLDALHETGNPDGLPASERMAWASDLHLPRMRPGRSCLIYFGDATCYDPRLQRIARAFESVLRAAEIDFGVLDCEPDSGAVVRILGEDSYLQDLITENLKQFAGRGVHEIVALGPYDYDVFHRFYKGRSTASRVFHATEYLDCLIQYESLAFGLELDGPRRAFYHDPCYLGRHHDLYEAPRRVLRAMPGLELLEFSDARGEAVCCGGGGARFWLEEDPGEGFADQRVKEAAERHADLIVTSCPYCIRMFEESVDKLGVTGIDVRDVVELAAVWWPYVPDQTDSLYGYHDVG